MKKWVISILCFSMMTMTLYGCSFEQDNHVLAAAVYPSVVKYPNSEDYYDEKSDTFDNEGYEQAYDAWLQSKESKTADVSQIRSFFEASLPVLLEGEANENRVYSPLNLYFALAMLAQISDGSSRQQILDALGVSDLSILQQNVQTLWQAHYEDDGIVTSLLANSVWLNEGVDYRQETLNVLAEQYFASSFQGEMGSAAYHQQLQSWLSEQTNGLLDQAANSMSFDPQTVIALVSTINYQAQWQDSFLEEDTKKDVFHALDGDLTCDFMHLSEERNYYQADHFSAVSLALSESGKMWLILPKTDLESVLHDASLMSLLAGEIAGESMLVHLSMPKFDVMSQINLTDGLWQLGITDIFDEQTANFTPLTANTDGVYLSEAKHAARVIVDEKGCTGTAFTMLTADMTSLIMPDKEIDFVLDTPFLFVVTSSNQAPLFAGIVHKPE